MRWGRRTNVVSGRFGTPRDTQRAKRSEQRKGTKRRRSWTVFVPLWVGAALLGSGYGAGWLSSRSSAGQAATSTAAAASASFSYCHTGGGRNCVVDGDTIWLEGQKIRIADIDAPETHNFKCASEKELGDRATRRLHDLLESGAIAMQPIDRDEDRYGRKLRVVTRGGRSLGDQLVSEGLARTWTGRREPWCA